MLYMFLADGFEETEAIGSLDVIRRAGLEIKTVGIDGKIICGSHGIKVTADIEKSDVDFQNMAGVILPGGMPGTTNLENDELVVKAVRFCMDNHLLLAAICAAPMVLGKLGALRGKKAVCYPGFEEHLDGAILCSDGAVADGNIVTGKGAGASLVFGAKIVDCFKAGKGLAILKQMQHNQE
ncbi:MAG: DJ-1/PfpI family protein [Clostridia bacterium]|nr:DJ-1/PfpI family protein [Clostridia bacterium]MBR6523301.1 DJ-1/PfpI family protein [Clostridia bacterium]